MAFRYMHAARKAENLLFRLLSKKCTEYEIKRNLRCLSRFRVPSYATTESILSKNIFLEVTSLKQIQVLFARSCSKTSGDSSSNDSTQKENNDSEKPDKGSQKENNDPEKPDSGSQKENRDSEKQDTVPKEMNKDAFFKGVLAVVAAYIFLSTFYIFEPEPITWQDFAELYIGKGMNGYLQVTGDTCVVHSDITKMKKVHFNIGDPEMFEKKLQQTEDSLNVPPESRWRIKYHSNDISMVLKEKMLEILFIGTILLIYLRRSSILGIEANRSNQSGADLASRMAFKRSLRVMKTDVGFKDVAGCEEAKAELKEFVSLLDNPLRYKKLGAKIPKGGVLTGPPGTGKTLLAKAIAGEANVPFIPVSGAGFIEMYAGLGPSRVREMFEFAAEKAPCILFIDEIDAVGRARNHSYNSENDSTVNELLVQLDGMVQQKDVIVMAATNRLEILDKALLRPGRFDRQIYVGLPDILGRVDLFKLYLKDLKTDLNKEELAKTLAAFSTGFSGADIANLCNEAALITARDGKASIGKGEFDRAVDRVVAGMEKKSKRLSPVEKKIVAYHEAGHAVAGWFLEHAPPVLKVSIIPTGSALGYAMYSPMDMKLFSKEQLNDNICMALGGRVAEDVFFTDITTGAQDDLDKATKIAYTQVLRFGMGDTTGLISWDKVFPYSDKQSEVIDTEVRNVMKSMYTRTKELINKHKESVEKIAKILMEREKIDRETLIETIGRRPFPEALTYDEMLEKARIKTHQKTKTENKSE